MSSVACSERLYISLEFIPEIGHMAKCGIADMIVVTSDIR